MKKFYYGLMGLILGLSNVVAGLSAGTIAVLVNVYDDLIDVSGNILIHPIKTLKKHWLFMLGIVVGLVTGIFTIGTLYNNFPLPTSLFFCGIVAMGVPPLLQKIKISRLKVKDYIAFILGVAIIIALPLITPAPEGSLTLNITTCVILFFIGAIAASGMLLPGIAGSLILVCFGYYGPLLNLVKRIVSNVFTLNFTNFGSDFVLALVFTFGCAVGLIFASKAIKYSFKHFFQTTYALIIGLVMASVVAIIIVALSQDNFFNETKDIISWGIGLVLFAIGGYLCHLIFKKMKTKSLGFEEKIAEYKSESIDFLKELIEYPSVLTTFDPNSNEPFGKANADCLNHFLAHAKADGFDVKNIDNYAGHIEMGSGEELIGILGHLDVVPTGDDKDWISSPFKATIKDNAIYGRGATDDKGPTVAAYYAMKIIKDLNLPISKRIRLIVGSDEESGSRCLEHYFKFEEKPSSGFSPDADFPLIYGEKAILSFDITGILPDTDELIYFDAGERYNIVPSVAKMKLNKDYKSEFLTYMSEKGYKGEIKDDVYIAYGRSAHASHPEEGINAAYILTTFLFNYTNSLLGKYMYRYLNFDHFGQKLEISVTDPSLKHLTSNVGLVKVDAKNVKIGINYRVPVDGYEEKVLAKMKKTFTDFPTFDAKVISVSNRHYVDPNSPLVSKLYQAYVDVTKDYENKPYTIGGGTYARFIENAVAFGAMYPNEPDVCHIANEYMKLDEFYQTMLIYCNAIYALIK